MSECSFLLSLRSFRRKEKQSRGVVPHCPEIATLACGELAMTTQMMHGKQMREWNFSLCECHPSQEEVLPLGKDQNDINKRPLRASDYCHWPPVPTEKGAKEPFSGESRLITSSGGP